METRQKTLTRGQEKDVEGDAEPEAGAPFPGDGSAGAGSGSPGPSRSPPTSGWAIQSAHARLADLLHAAASILDELTLGGAGAPGGVPGRRMGRVPAEKRAIPAQNFDVTSGGGDVTSAGDAAAGDDVTSAGGVTASGGHDVNRPGGQGAEVPRVTSAICGLTPGEAEFSELLLQRDGQVAACAAARVDEVPDAQAFASQRAASWRGADRPRQGETRGRHGPPRALAGVTCYNCGQLGHLASGCPAPRRRASGHPPSSARPPAAPQDPQV
ncbi:uncharacterized protein LOC133352510 [Lethenteron reissneri]|uniref:uncharacterized protein LOC133352510 n=1 Tax=Lethenteron reissneri TaxID=7753 RepID=UPI002AB6C802|nr:uncharacterized protein LOC133348671 isoform X2 [Lethenteron reissneri]XP_061424177.1 uncharacterized protein LOC133352510 [Lethenteron reissneri]